MICIIQELLSKISIELEIKYQSKRINLGVSIYPMWFNVQIRQSTSSVVFTFGKKSKIKSKSRKILLSKVKVEVKEKEKKKSKRETLNINFKQVIIIHKLHVFIHFKYWITQSNE